MQSGARRFEVHHQLGAGGMGVVYEAFDHHRGHRVALKRLPELDPTRLYLFKNEFRAVADVNHPNVVQLYELMTDDEGWFFTMELLEGVDFRPRVCPHPDPQRPPSRSASMAGTATRTAITRTDGVVDDEPHAREPTTPRTTTGPHALNPDMDRLRSALEQLTLGVTALHRADIVHRDLKPSNVLISDSDRLTICDFGIATDWRHHRRDDVLEKRVETQRATVPDRLSRALLARGEAALLLRRGRAQAAIDRLEEIWRAFEEGRVALTYVWAALPAALASAYRSLAETAPERGRRRQALKRAKSYAHVAVRHARFFTNDLPHALREAGCCDALAGRPRRAHAAFDESLRIARTQGARLEALLTEQADALLARRTRRPGTERRLERTHAELDALGAAFHIRQS